ncbi:MAG: hypothetical protein V3S68_06985 [Dehalococcoidia bacterium]
MPGFIVTEARNIARKYNIEADTKDQALEIFDTHPQYVENQLISTEEGDSSISIRADEEPDPLTINPDRLEKLLDHLEDATDTADALAVVRDAYAQEFKSLAQFERAWKDHADCMADLEA